MRVCDLTTLYLDGSESGVNTYLLEKARYLAACGDTSHVMIVPGQRDERRRLFDTTVYTIKSPRLPGNPQHRVLARVSEVQRILREERPTVVEVDCAYLLGRVAEGALASHNVPVVGFYHVHLPTFIARPASSRFGSAFSGVFERLAWRYVDHCYQHVDRLVVTSGDVHDRLRAEGFGRLELIPLGVNLELFRPGATGNGNGNGNGHHAPHGNGNGNGHGPKRPIQILYVGRLAREKDLEVLLDAFKMIRDHGDYRLRLVGDGPMRKRLEGLAAGDDRIEFLGLCPYGEDLARIYASSDILALPSPNETFNLTILEGLASGLPVVGVRRGGPVNLVTEEVGALAAPGDAADFGRKLEAVAARLGRYPECRAYTERHYSWRRTFDRLLGVYDRVLTARGRNDGERFRCGGALDDEAVRSAMVPGARSA